MKRRVIAVVLCLSMVLGLISGCGKKNTKDETVTKEKQETKTETETSDMEESAFVEPSIENVESLERPSIGSNIENSLYEENIVPSVPEYSVDISFSNVINAEDCVLGEYVADAYREKLAKNLFVVGESSGFEFWEQYEFNAYSQTPNFVTVDSLMHTYHLYFAHLLKTIEKASLSDAVKTISSTMFNKSMEQYDEFKGTEWEEAAVRNVAYFAVACELSGVDISVPDFAIDTVNSELDHIMSANGIELSNIIPDTMEDYSQYKPRGYYEGDEQLEKYFRTMMWYGRITFIAGNDSATRSAVLMSIALKESAISEWESVYAVTSFFAGASDDLGYCEYMPVIEAAYGGKLDKDSLVGNESAWGILEEKISEMDPPRIQSIPVYEDEENVIPGFRLMGQRFTIDGNIMQNLIYRAVDENAEGNKRMLPMVLDVPAALGSDVAKEIALENGAKEYPDYETNLNRLREDINSSSDSLWNASLYSGWINTLRPLLVEKGDGYPSFMKNSEWTKKTLETFAGSFAELKHDTVLYSKQPMAEMGGGDLDPVDDRGYVEPEPLVYARFSNLAKTTSEGLKKFGMLSSDDEKNLGLLVELSDKLLVIAQKELKNELPSDEEFELIRNYGGNIEHFWYDAMKDDAGKDSFTSEEFPAAIIVDVATDPNGLVLEAGTGSPRTIAVVVPVDGILRIAMGSVYDYYEFEWPLSNRLTDNEWRRMVGAESGLGFLYEKDDSIVNPDWTTSYREEKWHWEW
ncbi:MAG: DUF3160 domain-containing protein [Lachnospiraceae bacterium]|nr:DUF3160 domain-containing protein [Lachnospiraceae bacterium]